MLYVIIEQVLKDLASEDVRVLVDGLKNLHSMIIRDSAKNTKLGEEGVCKGSFVHCFFLVTYKLRSQLSLITTLKRP